MRSFAQTAFVLYVFGALVFIGYRAITAFAPREHVPWTPISIDDPIGRATAVKLADFKNEPRACFATLEVAGVAFTRLVDSSSSDDCGFNDALTLDRSGVPYSATLQMTCPLTAALATWERQVAMPLAEEILGSPLARVETYGSYSCRRLYGRTSGRFSQHARANAVDISGFVLADGRTISVLRHWDAESAEGRYLAALRDGACEVFATVLSPDYNEAHADHFHLDMGMWSVCR